MAWLLIIGPLLLLFLALVTGSVAAAVGYARIAVVVRAVAISCALLAIWIGFGDGFVMRLDVGLLVSDGLARFAMVIILLSSAGFMLLAERDMYAMRLLKASFVALMLLAVIGALIIVMADDLLVLFLGIEIQACALYGLGALRRGSRSATAAGLQQGLLGLMTSGVLLYGVLLCGRNAGVDYGDLAWSGTTQMGFGFQLGALLIVLAIVGKMQLAPLHMMLSEFVTYAPRSIAAFSLVVPRLALLVGLWRFLYMGVPMLQSLWMPVLVGIAVLNMATGLIKALRQEDFKILITWIVTAQMGIGLAAVAICLKVVFLVWLAVFAMSMVGIAAFWVCMDRDGRQVSDLLTLEGLGQHRPARAAALAVLLLSLVGMPPLTGFLVVFGLLDAMVDVNQWTIMIICLMTFIGLSVPVFQLIARMFFAEPIDPIDSDPELVPRMIMTGTALAALFGGGSLLGILDWALRAMFVP